MRDIKFRAWYEDRKTFEYFILAKHAPITTVQIPACGTWDDLSDWEQFTGLIDINGVDIYEGDIVQWGHIDGYIELSGTRVAVVDMSVPSDGLVFDAYKPRRHRFEIGCFMYAECTDQAMEVIGNTHQNPELLQ